MLSDWLSLVVRWLHVITGIAWIGASFYFNWLLNRLVAPAEGDEHVTGELWAIHAGGFFRVQKRVIPRGGLPRTLHWFKWEAYWTWISGIALLSIVYYAGAAVYLIDPAVADISQVMAVAVGLGAIVASWFIYDGLWRSPLAERRRLMAAISFALLVLVAWGLSRVFSGRGAYIHVGAILGTLMVGNVARVIMPAQRELVSAAAEGRTPSPALAANAALRSLHNNYLTLPVVFVMISNHYPGTYGHALNWLVLAALFLGGAAVRHYFNIRHRRGNLAGAWLLGAAGVGVVALAALTAPRPIDSAGAGRVSFARARDIVQQRCVPCHSAHPSSEMFHAPPKDVSFDTPALIKRYASRIEMQAVSTQAMPLGNLTGMTSEERALLGRWIREGASIQ